MERISAVEEAPVEAPSEHVEYIEVPKSMCDDASMVEPEAHVKSVAFEPIVEFPKVIFPDDVKRKTAPIDRGTTSKRMLAAVEKNVGFFVKDLDVRGLEHLTEIPPNKRVVIVTTHASDLDIPIVIKTLGPKFDLAVSDAATNHTLGNIAAKFGLAVAGEENFIPIDYKFGKKDIEAGFNPENFVRMADVLERGKTVVVAAHNSSRKDRLEKGGVGGVYLAQLGDAVIVPVAVNVKAKNASSPLGFVKMLLGKKSGADVCIGKPLEFAEVEGIDDYRSIMAKRRSGERISAEELARFKEISRALKAQSAEVMETLAEMMPEEKRGMYAEDGARG